MPDLDDTLLTPGQVAALLKLDESTVRRYCRQFAEHLSPSASATGRRRRFTSSDVAILARARDLLRSHTPAEVGALLSIVESEPAPAAVTTTLPALADEVGQARALLATLGAEVRRQAEEQRAQIAEQAHRIAELAEMAEEQRAEQAQRIDELAGQVTALRDELEREHRRSWLDRLLGRQAK